MDEFAALPGIYRLLFLYLEPVSTIMPAVLAWGVPGAAWFHHELVPGGPGAGVLDGRSTMAIWQLGNCYLLLGLLSSLVFRAVRDALPGNAAAQERILGAAFLALGIADATHIAATVVGLGPVRAQPWRWNAMTHGNVTFVVLLLGARVAWFAGVGRRRFYYGRRIS